MIISDENSQPLLIDSLTTPLLTTHFWTLNLELKDFRLSELKYIEEYTAPMLVIKCKQYALEVPSNWNILIYSEETHDIDIVNIYDLCKGDYNLFLVDHTKNKLVNNVAQIIDYQSSSVFHTPQLNKNEMLCTHFGEKYWALISPIDNYHKYLKDCAVGDIL